MSMPIADQLKVIDAMVDLIKELNSIKHGGANETIPGEILNCNHKTINTTTNDTYGECFECGIAMKRVWVPA